MSKIPRTISGAGVRTSSQEISILMSAEINPGIGDNGEEGWYQRSDHPLLNDLILSTFFEYVRPLDLKPCRVVCKKWNVSSIPFTRNTWKVTIYGSEYGGSAPRATLQLYWIGKFLEVFSSNQLGIPLARFQLGAFSMTDVIGQQFLALCGEMAKEIDLSLESEVFMVEDVSALLRSTPNLIKFKLPRRLDSRSSTVVKLFPGSEYLKPKLSLLTTLESLTDFPAERIKCCPSFMDELFLAAENISHISIGPSRRVDASDKVCTSVEVLTVIEKLKRESAIQTLHFADIYGKHVEIMRRMKSNGLKLKGIKFPNNFINFKKFMEVATIFKDTLEHFITVEWCRDSMNLPRMSSLKCLKLSISKEFNLKIVNLNHLFPALEKFDLSHSGCAQEYEFFPQSDPCPKMKSFKLSTSAVQITGFNRTLSLFPKLTELYLQMETDGSVLRHIWSQMTQLKILRLKGSIQRTENLDSVFTGISNQSLQEIEPLVSELGKMTREVQGETILRLRNEHSLLPSIANLINLRRLELHVTSEVDDDDELGPTYLTDVTGYLALYAMKELRHLEIDPAKLTETCYEILSADLGLQSLYFRGVY